MLADRNMPKSAVPSPANLAPVSLEDQLNWLSSLVGEQYSILEELGKKLVPLTLPVDHACDPSAKTADAISSPVVERTRAIARSLDYHNNMIKQLMQNLTL